MKIRQVVESERILRMKIEAIYIKLELEFQLNQWVFESYYIIDKICVTHKLFLTKMNVYPKSKILYISINIVTVLAKILPSKLCQNSL